MIALKDLVYLVPIAPILWLISVAIARLDLPANVVTRRLIFVLEILALMVYALTNCSAMNVSVIQDGPVLLVKLTSTNVPVNLVVTTDNVSIKSMAILALASQDTLANNVNIQSMIVLRILARMVLHVSINSKVFFANVDLVSSDFNVKLRSTNVKVILAILLAQIVVWIWTTLLFVIVVRATLDQPVKSTSTIVLLIHV